MFQQTCDGGLFSAPAFLQLERLAPQPQQQHLYQPPTVPQPLAQAQSHSQYRSPAEESPPLKKTPRAHPYQRPLESSFQSPLYGASAAQSFTQNSAQSSTLNAFPVHIDRDGAQTVAQGVAQGFAQGFAQGSAEGLEEGDEDEGEAEEVVSESEMHVVRAAPGSVVCETGAWRNNGTKRKVVKPERYVPVEMVEDDSDSDSGSGSDTSTDVAEALKDVEDAVIETDDEEAAAIVPDEDDADFVTNEVDESDLSYHESDKEEEEEAEESEASSSEEEEESEAEFSGESSD